MRNRAPEAHYEPLLRSLYINADPHDVKPLLAEHHTVKHELYHALQHNGTTVGLFLLFLQALKALQFATYTSIRRDDGPDNHPNLGPPPFFETWQPFFKKWQNEMAGPVSRGAQSALELFVIWQSTRRILDIFYGNNVEYSTDTAALCKSLKHCVQGISYYTQIELDGFPDFAEIKHIMPKVGVGPPLRSYGVGARMIMEHSAALAVKNFPDDEDTLVAMRILREIHAPISHILLLPLLQVKPLREGGFKMLKNTVLAISDIALMAPLPVFNMPCAEWEDIHPGHRWFKCVEILVRGEVLPVSGEQDRGRFFDDICCHAGWPTIGNLSRTYLQSPFAFATILGCPFPAMAFGGACLLRSQQPQSIAYPAWQTLVAEIPACTPTEELLRMVGRPTILIFRDGEKDIWDDMSFHVMHELQIWRWLGEQMMEHDHVDFETSNYLCGPPSLAGTCKRNLYKVMVENAINDGSGKGMFWDLDSMTTPSRA